MISTSINFSKEKNGYDIAQVDSYIKKVSEAYQATYYEYLDISGKYKSLLEKQGSEERTERTGRTGLDPDVAAKTLINTEILAKKIIADAQEEANALMEEARITENRARAEAITARDSAQKLLDDANAEIGKARIEAQNIIKAAESEAHSMAGQIKKGIEKAQSILRQSAGEVMELLAPAQ